MKGIVRMFPPINKLVQVCLLLAVCLTLAGSAGAQKNRTRIEPKKSLPAPATTPTPDLNKLLNDSASDDDNYAPGTIIDDRLSLLRIEPSLSAVPLQRMRHGRTVLIYSS